MFLLYDDVMISEVFQQIIDVSASLIWIKITWFWRHTKCQKNIIVITHVLKIKKIRKISMRKIHKCVNRYVGRSMVTSLHARYQFLNIHFRWFIRKFGEFHNKLYLASIFSNFWSGRFRISRALKMKTFV